MNFPSPIYADYASSAPPLPEVVEAMMEWLGGSHANPHADHLPGHRAARAIDDARHHIADLLDADPEGVIFTSGATESNNLALKGLVGCCSGGIYFSPLDHSSIVEVANYLSVSGKCRTGVLEHDAQGSISAAAVSSALGSGQGRSLVAIAHGNNEIGTIQALSAIGNVIATAGHLLHVDASQTAAHVPISVSDMQISSLSISGHKLYGPAGIGALWLEPALRNELLPIFHGGGQQGGTRSGTVPTYLAVGLGVAARLARDRMEHSRAHLQAMASQFLVALASRGFPPLIIGHPSERLPGHLSLRFPGADAQELLTMLMPKVAFSTGAACAAGELRPSRVLHALGVEEDCAREVMRFSFGRSSEASDVALAVEHIVNAMHNLQTR